MGLQFYDGTQTRIIATIQDNVPIGTMWAYTGTWVDDDTIRGWYACTAANAIAFPGQVPDLEESFVYGGVTQGTISSGCNIKIIQQCEIPAHTHTVLGHSHNNVSTGTSGSTHCHTIGTAFTCRSHSSHNHVHCWTCDFGREGNSTNNAASCTRDFESTGTSKGLGSHGAHCHTTGSQSHSHTVTDNTTAFDSGSTFTGVNTVDWRPPYYTVIFIIKVANSF